jgi:hypothetical protein
MEKLVIKGVEWFLMANLGPKTPRDYKHLEYCCGYIIACWSK